MLYDAVPQKLKALPHWIVWKFEERDGKENKVPYDAKTGEKARSNDPSTWTTFEEAQEKADVFSANKYDGIGFMLHGTNLVGIDFDSVIEGTAPEPFVMNILEQLGNPYSEITPSGKGVRCFVECDTLPEGKRKFSGGHYGAEIYSGGEGGRYLTVTGNRLQGEGIPQLSTKQMEIPYFLLGQMKNLRFKKQWTGDASEYDDDDSRLDLALLNNLIRLLATKDRETLERYFDASVPGHREKWVNREDYRNRTFEALKMGEKSIEKVRLPLRFAKDAVDKTSAFEYVVDAPKSLNEREFDGWFPLGSPSLIGGPSGSGKSTLMIDLLIKQAQGIPVFNHLTNSRPYLILMFDRGKGSHERTMRRMGYFTTTLPIKFMKAVLDNEASQEVINQIELFYYENKQYPQVVFIEGMDMLVRDANKKEIVMPFMAELQQIAAHFHCAVIGSTGAPKTKAKEGYTAKRDQIFGSEAWSRLSETVVVMQLPEGKDTAGQRLMTVMLRNGKPEEFRLQFENGHLELMPEEVPEEGIPEPTDAVDASNLQRAIQAAKERLRGGPVVDKAVKQAVMRRTGVTAHFVDNKVLPYMFDKKMVVEFYLGKYTMLELVPEQHPQSHAVSEEKDFFQESTIPEGEGEVEESL